MKGKERIMQGLTELGKKLKSSKTSFLSGKKGLGGTLAQKTTGLRSSLRKLVKGAKRSSG